MQATSAGILILLSANVLIAQPAGTRLAYEAASVKLTTSATGGSHTDGTPGQILMQNMPLDRLIEMAYSVGPHRVAGPDWMSAVHVDIAAKYPPDTKGADKWLMLRSLLEDSFKLATHRETKEMQGYALVVAKGGFKLKPVESVGNDTHSSGGRVRTLTAKATSLAYVADMAARSVGAVVADKTGIDGVFDFELRWANGDPEGDRADDTPTIFVALQETLGLRLQAQRVPVEVIVVDHLERTPVEN
jgi:uncharacterized protein (TIGR03435 family)